MGRKATGTVGFWDGIWHARVTQPDKSRPWIPLPGINSRERAKSAARDIASAIKQGHAALPARKRSEPRSPAVSVRETVTDYFERWNEHRRDKHVVSAATDRSRFVGHIRPMLGHLRVDLVARRDLERLVERLDAKVDAEDMAAGTALRVWFTATKMFRDASRSKVAGLRVRDDNPARDVEGPDPAPGKVRQFLYPSEFLRLVECEDVPVQDARTYAIAVYTFMRASELAALGWDGLDIEHRMVHVHVALDRVTLESKETKTGIARRIAMPSELVPIFEQIRRECAGSPVPTIPGDRMAAARFREHLKAAGINRDELYATTATRRAIRFHDLRATGITWAAIRGDDPLKIQQRAGHLHFTTTQGYIRTAEAHAEAFGEPFPPLPKRLATPTGRTLSPVPGINMARGVASRTVSGGSRGQGGPARSSSKTARSSQPGTSVQPSQTPSRPRLRRALDDSQTIRTDALEPASRRLDDLDSVAREVVKRLDECVALVVGPKQSARSREAATLRHLEKIARLKLNRA